MRRAGFVLCCLLTSGVVLAAEDPLADDPDPLDWPIRAERLGVQIQRASEAADTVNDGSASRNVSAYTLRADLATKQAAADLLMLRNKLLAKGMPGPDRRINWPVWMFEPPSASTPKRVLNDRIEWLETEVEAMTDAICTIAAAINGDHLVCSVE
jgi:hypothetical protein